MYPSITRPAAVLACILISLAVHAGQPESAIPAPAPGFLLDISREFFANGIAQSIDRADPVHDVILKARISGTGRTVANVTVALVPCEEAAALDLVTTGTTYAQTVGVSGPVQVYNDSAFPFQIRQRVYLQPAGVLADCPHARAGAGVSTLTGITTNFCLLDGLVKKIACNQYNKQKDKAQSIALQHAEQQLTSSAQAEAGPRLQDADQALKKGLADLRAEGIDLGSLRFSSSEDAVLVRAASAKTAPAGPPPPIVGLPYLALRLHETMVNESAQAKWGGRTLTGEQMSRGAKKLGGKDAPTPAEEKDFSITFVKRMPLEVAFADQGLQLILRLEEFTSGDDVYDGMDMTVKYKFEAAPGKIKAVRVGPIEAFPPGFKQGNKLNARQQAMRTVLQKRFGKFFKEELPLEDIVLSANLEKAGPLVAESALAEQGWLRITWRKGG